MSLGAALTTEGSGSLLALGVALGLCASFSFNLGLTIQKRAATGLPKVYGLSWRTLRSFCADKRWLFGNLLVAAGWVVQFFALLCAPIVLVMPAVAAGVVFQGLLCAFWLHEKLNRVEWLGIAACLIGIVLMGFSVDPRIEAASGSMNGVALSWAVAILVVLAGLGILAASTRKVRAETSLGAAAGLLYACTGLLTKALGIVSVREHHIAESVAIVAALVVLTSGALWIVQAAYQRGRALVIIPLMCMIADFLPALIGPQLFEEAWPEGRFALLRVVSLAVILVGSVLLVGRGEALQHTAHISEALNEELHILPEEDEREGARDERS